jgi:3'-phosphoadenosine 5'-phosphosulfate sulfotransferase (PAPS reductase)/FAD synthetase
MLTSEQIVELKAKINGRRVVASVSGGKDSAAMSLYLTELGIEHDRVFMDTGWEHPDTYKYLRGALTEKLGPIHEVRSAKYPKGMPQMVVERGTFPSRIRRLCTTELKIYPMRDYIQRRQDAGEELISVVGIRRAESEARSRMPEWEWNNELDLEVWRPLILWSEQDVIDIHHRHGLPPNPLYLRGEGVQRVGCWPCIFSRKAEIKQVAEQTPERIELIAQLEQQVAEEVHRKYRERGEVYEGQAPSFFYGHLVQSAVAWSKTAQGGKQFELFAAGERDAGCMRWGLCETNPDKGGSDE